MSVFGALSQLRASRKRIAFLHFVWGALKRFKLLYLFSFFGGWGWGGGGGGGGGVGVGGGFRVLFCDAPHALAVSVALLDSQLISLTNSSGIERSTHQACNGRRNPSLRHKSPDDPQPYIRQITPKGTFGCFGKLRRQKALLGTWYLSGVFLILDQVDGAFWSLFRQITLQTPNDMSANREKERAALRKTVRFSGCGLERNSP